MTVYLLNVNDDKEQIFDEILDRINKEDEDFFTTFDEDVQVSIAKKDDVMDSSYSIDDDDEPLFVPIMDLTDFIELGLKSLYGYDIPAWDIIVNDDTDEVEIMVSEGSFNA